MAWAQCFQICRQAWGTRSEPMTMTSGANISLANFLHDGYVSYIKALPKFVNFCPVKRVLRTELQQTCRARLTMARKLHITGSTLFNGRQNDKRSIRSSFFSTCVFVRHPRENCEIFIIYLSEHLDASTNAHLHINNFSCSRAHTHTRQDSARIS